MKISAADRTIGVHHDTERDVLSNGLTLLVRRDRSAPVVAIVTHVKAGYFDEDDDVAGIAHVLEHMYFKGTPTRGVGAIARDTKALGGYLNAHTIYDHTTYYTVLPSASFAAGLDIQCDAYARSSIDAGELARELEVIVQEAKRKSDTPGAVTIETLYAVLHDHHRIRRWRIGEEHALRALTQQQLLRFYRHWYQPSNTILSIVGDVDPAVVRREVAARYGALPDAPMVRNAGPVERTAPGVRFRDIERDVVQQGVAFGWRGLEAAHVDAPALDLAGVTLGTGRASRLYRAVRDRQLASSVGSWHYNSGDIGVFVLHADGPTATAPDAAAQMWQELQAVRQEGFQPREVLRAQRIMEARLLRRLETMDGQATYLALWEAQGGLDQAAAYAERLQALTAEELQHAVQHHLDPDQVSVVSLRPSDAAPLAADAQSLRERLRRVEGLGSSVMPPTSGTSTPGNTESGSTPAGHTPAWDATLIHAVPPSTPVTVIDGVHVQLLPSGITVLVLPRPGAPLASIGVFQRGGLGLETVGEEGIARLTAHAMLKGTASRTGNQIAETAEELGGSVGVSAGMENLGWSMSVPASGLSTAIELLADVLQHPVFPDDGVHVERALALADLSKMRDDMYRWPMRMASALAYGTHPYARAVVGTAASLDVLDATALRAFHARHILNAATVIAVVGDVQPEPVTACIANAFATLQYAGDAPLAPAPWPDGARRDVETRDKQQTAMAMLFPGADRNSSMRFAARVTSAIASGLGGRFFEQLRDKQSLAYTVSAFPVERRAGGAFAAYIATSPDREDEAREGLLREFGKFRMAAPVAVELARAQNYLIGAHAIGQQSGSAVLGELIDAFLFGHGIEERNEFAGRIAAVTGADVLEFATTHFDADRVIEGVLRGATQ